MPLEHVILERRVFISKAKNIGWRRARGEFVYFVDDDNCVTEETLKVPFETIASSPKIGALVPAVLYKRRPDLVWVYATPLRPDGWGHVLIGRNKPRDPLLEGRLLDTDALPNAAIVRRKALNEIGGFSEDLVVNSSAEAALKLKRWGWQVYAHTGAFIFHDVEPPGFTGYWAEHGAADPERVYHEVRDWFLLMRFLHMNHNLFAIAATLHAYGFMVPNGLAYLLRRTPEARESLKQLLRGYLAGLRATGFGRASRKNS